MLNLNLFILLLIGTYFSTELFKISVIFLSFVSGAVACIIFVYLSLETVKTKRFLDFSLPEIENGQLQKKGWIRISKYLLNQKDVYNEPFDLPNHLRQYKKKISNIDLLINAKKFIMDRFNGTDCVIKENSEDKKHWRNVFAQLYHQTLNLYSSKSQEHVICSWNLSDFKITLMGDSDYHSDPIKFRRGSSVFYIYCSSAAEKEDWFLKLSRCKKLPLGLDQEKTLEFYRDLQPVRSYELGMHKLEGILKGLDSESPIWLNALLGRAFISIHSNPRIKSWIMENISKRMAHVHTTSKSFLGDIVIKDLDVGNSLPIISNPRLLTISKDKDMEIELDLDYTGGISLEAATAASISVPAWTEYMRPINVPIMVKVSITKFSARMLLKVKPFWETNRIWFGFYRHPELKLELDVEPIISNKLVRIELVNQVIESRIKQALEEFVILPNMDSIVFWPFDREEDQESEEDSDFDSDSEQAGSSSDTIESNRDLAGSELDLNTNVNYSQEIGNAISDTEIVHEETELNGEIYMNMVGDAAFQIGQFVRDNGLDDAAKSVVENLSTKVDNYLGPAISYIQDTTKPCRDRIIEESVNLGKDLVDRLGLKPEISPIKLRGDESILKASTKSIRKSSSRILELMGLKISTHAPAEDFDGDNWHKKKKLLKTSSFPDFQRKMLDDSNISDISEFSGSVGGDSSKERSRLRRSRSSLIKQPIDVQQPQKSKMNQEYP